MADPLIGASHVEAGTATEFDDPIQLPAIDALDVDEHVTDNLASYVFSQWQTFRNHEDTIAFREKCNAALRMYRGEYSAAQLSEIESFGGSKVYSHITSTKCRGATALLRDIFLGQDQAWGLGPTADPKIPDDVSGQISQLVTAEAHQGTAAGQPVPQEAIDDRVAELTAAALRQAEVKAREEAKEAEKYLQDILVEGGFYDALVDLITDLPIFPHAVMKGPVVKNVSDNRWVDGKLVRKTVPKMFWYRVSPFDLYFTPGASNITESSTIEYSKMSRAELNTMIGLPGYDEESIRAVLTEYSAGHIEARGDDSERAYREGREDPYFNQSGLIDALEWQGPIQGRMLLDYGYTDSQIPDPDLDYFVQAWVIGRHTIKVQIKPDVTLRPNYFVTSFEKLPGGIRGLGLPDILGDIQRMANGALRALANNMAMASGPQIAVDESRLSPSTNADKVYPWKRWRFLTDPSSSTTIPAVSFFQPQSNAHELLGVYQSMTNISDETSSIPRYLTGNESVGGAGRTASGLSMLMSSASKMMQVVAANIDRDVMRPAIQMLYDMVMMVDQGKRLRGDEDIQIRGVEIARQKEMERTRRLEFLQITQNPVDQQLIGLRGRAHLLRAMLDDMGLPGADIVPTDRELEAMELKQKEQAQQELEMQQAAAAQGEDPTTNAQSDSAEMGNDMRAMIN
jgi:hypothetical protein